MKDLILEIVPIVISFVALVLSIVVAFKNRKQLTVDFRKGLTFAEGGSIFFFDEHGVIQPYGDALVTTVEIVNPSPTDIAFFDLRAFNPATNLNINLLTKRTQLTQYRPSTVWHTISNGEESALYEMLIPEKNYGILKSNSFERFDIVIFPPPELKEVCISFKVAMKARVKDPFAITSRKRYKFYGMTYDISNFEKLKSESTQLEKQAQESN